MPTGKMVRVLFAALVAVVFFAQGAIAQESFWIQLAARKSLTQAKDEARALHNIFENVHGFRTTTGWYALALGPFTRTEADRRLVLLRANGDVPRDSFVADGRRFRTPFWPDETVPPAVAETQTGDGALAEPAPAPVVEQPKEPEETRAEALRGEGLLSRDAKADLQRALQLGGHYSGAIDGLFGRGTRTSMAAWQSANGFVETGVLTTQQRETLIDGYNKVLEPFGFQQFDDTVAGISATLPLALVGFDRYEPPFAHYSAKESSGPSVLLISQSGGRTELQSLYAVLQKLDMMPLEGTRRLYRDRFVLTGQDGDLISHAEAKVVKGAVKGFVLVWPTARSIRDFDLALEHLRNSFDPNLAGVLPEDYGTPSPQAIDLLAGLQLRQPASSRSGFFVDRTGKVLTTVEAVTECRRITIDTEFTAEIMATQDDIGLALLRPTTSLMPAETAVFLSGNPKLASQISVAGYSYGGQLKSPSITFGTLENIVGLNGETDLRRLALTPLEGDFGGPVMDESGLVFGLLARVPGDAARQLPPDVQFAVHSSALARFLTEQGVNANLKEAGEDTLEPDEIFGRARGMTALVDCWK